MDKKVGSKTKLKERIKNNVNFFIYFSSSNVILCWTPGTSIGVPLITRGLYLNLDEAFNDALAKRLLVHSTIFPFAVVPFLVTTNSTIRQLHPGQARTPPAARRLALLAVVLRQPTGATVGGVVHRHLPSQIRVAVARSQLVEGHHLPQGNGLPTESAGDA